MGIPLALTNPEPSPQFSRRRQKGSYPRILLYAWHRAGYSAFFSPARPKSSVDIWSPLGRLIECNGSREHWSHSIEELVAMSWSVISQGKRKALGGEKVTERVFRTRNIERYGLVTDGRAQFMKQELEFWMWGFIRETEGPWELGGPRVLGFY